MNSLWKCTFFTKCDFRLPFDIHEKAKHIFCQFFFPENIVIHFGIMDLYQDAKNDLHIFFKTKTFQFQSIQINNF